eukprot:736341-Hanusia_phi.AAC.7
MPVVAVLILSCSPSSCSLVLVLQQHAVRVRRGGIAIDMSIGYVTSSATLAAAAVSIIRFASGSPPAAIAK